VRHPLRVLGFVRQKLKPRVIPLQAGCIWPQSSWRCDLAALQGLGSSSWVLVAKGQLCESYGPMCARLCVLKVAAAAAADGSPVFWVPWEWVQYGLSAWEVKVSAKLLHGPSAVQ